MTITHKPTLDLIAAGLASSNIESIDALAARARCAPDDTGSLIVALNILDYGRYLADARRAVEDAMDSVKVMLRDGAAKGLSVSFMAEAGGVTRQTVYDAIRAQEAS